MRPVLFFILVLAVLPSCHGAVGAMYSFVDETGRLHFTNVPADSRYREMPGFEKIRRAAVRNRYETFVMAAAERYDLDPGLIRAVIEVESGYNPYAVSTRGAMGLMQLMPETAREMQIGAPFEAEANIMGGSRYLRKMLNLFDGDLRLGLAAYNAGPNRVLQDGAVPGIRETREYVKKVLQEYERRRAHAVASQ